MEKRKIISIIILVCMLCGLIAGCGNKNTKEGTTSDNSEDKKTIGLVVHSLDDNYVSYLVDAFENTVSKTDDCCRNRVALCRFQCV